MSVKRLTGQPGKVVLRGSGKGQAKKRILE